MPKKIGRDHKKFRDIVAGRAGKSLRRLIKSGQIVRQRGKNGKLVISIPKIDIPHFLYGDSDEGVKRGKGKDGTVIGKDPQEGDGDGNPGDEHADGIQIVVDLEDVLKFLQDEIKLPALKPKPSEIFEEVKIKYTSISRTGPESLRHTRRTMIEAMKRLATSGDLDNLHYVPGMKEPIPLIVPQQCDKRYRQYREFKVPTSNAVIFFARDCSGSMDQYRCDVVSDMSWWLDCWIKKFYTRVERRYLIHDTIAEEVDENTFYKYRMGGGTVCSSAFKKIQELIETKFPPSKYNIYIFYFTDGDNWEGDNVVISNTIKENLNSDVVNLIGVAQILTYYWQGSVKRYLDNKIESGGLDKNLVRTYSIGSEKDSGWGSIATISEEERNKQILDAIKYFLSPIPQDNPVGI